MPEHQATQQPIVRLHDLIRKSQDALVADWTAEVRTLSPAHELSQPVLVDASARDSSLGLPTRSRRRHPRGGSLGRCPEEPRPRLPGARLRSGTGHQRIRPPAAVPSSAAGSASSARPSPLPELRRLDAALDPSISD